MSSGELSESQQRIADAQKVTWVGFAINLILSLGKVLAGVFGNSAAMLADGVHSLSDFVTDVIVIVFLRISGKEPDEDHRYGHGKFETLATFLIAAVLVMVAIGMARVSIMLILDVIHGALLPRPDMIALWMALISLIVKELLYQYSAAVGRRIASPSVIANAWHHRSDALSSLATGLGIAGAIFLSERWRILDPIAGLLVSIFILKLSYDLARPSVEELMESALPAESNELINEVILAHPQVMGMGELRTRRVGHRVIIDVHVHMSASLSFAQSHRVTEVLESELQKKLGGDVSSTIHAEPLED